MSKTTDTLAQLSDVSRRDALKSIAIAVTVVGSGRMKLEAAQQVHQHAKEEKKKTGVYQPKLFNAHEFETLGRLAELIVPADEVSRSARDAGAPEFIDLLTSQNEDLASIFTGGLSWLDSEMRHRYSSTFVEAKEEQQIATLDLLVETAKTERERRAKGLTFESSEHYKDFAGYGVYAPSDLGPGIYFFDWLRKMTVDAFYTSEIGIKDLDFRGNGALSKYEVPKEVIEYALNHSPFRTGS
jgi:gluconate 2-dehydrogenase gamma chain